MPQLPTAPVTPSRKRLHTRTILLEGYKRDDGLFDIEARLADVKDHDYAMPTGMWRKGEPMHHMQVRLTIDHQFNILAAHADFLAAPYTGCPDIAPDYGKIVGLNLLRGFRRQVSKLFADAAGCAHVTELLSSLPTAAIQALSSERKESNSDGGAKPPHLDRCHELVTTGATVKCYYPRWYRETESGGQVVPEISSGSNLQRARKMHEDP